MKAAYDFWMIIWNNLRLIEVSEMERTGMMCGLSDLIFELCWIEDWTW